MPVLVYCVEQPDQSAPLAAVTLDGAAAITQEKRADLPGGVVALRQGKALFINRETTAMQVWVGLRRSAV